MRRDRTERPLPERPRLSPPPDFIPHAVRLNHPFGEGLTHRTPERGGPAEWALLTVERVNQVTCDHWLCASDRFGEAECVLCSVRAWSPWWVAWGVFGDDTENWIVSEIVRRA